MVDAPAELVARAVDGDADALAALLARYGPPIEAELRIGRAWRDVLDAGDVMQVTYLEAFLQIAHYDASRPDSFAAWLRRIADNNLRDAIRALEAQKSLPPSQRIAAYGDGDSYLGLFDILTATAANPSRRLRREESSMILAGALERLPPAYAAVVRMYDLQGWPISEVAETLQRKPGAIHMLRLRAHDRLRELIGSPSRVFDTTA